MVSSSFKPWHEVSTILEGFSPRVDQVRAVQGGQFKAR